MRIEAGLLWLARAVVAWVGFAFLAVVSLVVAAALFFACIAFVLWLISPRH